jgi:hypothetical protein
MTPPGTPGAISAATRAACSASVAGRTAAGERPAIMPGEPASHASLISRPMTMATRLAGPTVSCGAW